MGYGTFTKFVLGTLFIGVLLVVGVQVWARTAPTPGDVGPVGDGLRPCESAANCVTSESQDPEIAVRPLTCGVLGGESLLQAATAALAGLERTSIVEEGRGYVHAVSESAFFGFKDDVELRLAPGGRVVHVRSESRLGNGDLGVNRERVDRLHAAMDATC